MSEVKVKVGADGTDRIQRQFRAMAAAVGGLGESAGASAGKVDRAVRAIDSKLSGTAARLTGLMSGIGVGMVARDLMKTEARLVQLGIKLGVSQQAVVGFYGELNEMSQRLAVPTDQLLAAAEALLADDMAFAQVRAGLPALGDAMLQTGASGDALAKAALVIQSNFGYGLDTAQDWVKLLDMMTTAGQKGSVELEDLASIVPAVGQNARAAGMQVSEMLGMLEMLGKFEKRKGNLATLADSFLRPFTDMTRLGALKKVGINPFDPRGAKRGLDELLSEITTKFQAKKTDLERMRFIEALFGKGLDLDTKKALQVVLGPGALDGMRSLSGQIAAGGSITEENRARALATMERRLARIKAQWEDIASTQGGPVLQTLSALTDKLAENPALTQGLMQGGLAVGAGGLGLKVLARSAGLLESLMPVAKRAGGGGGGALASLGAQRVWVVNMPGGDGFGVPGLPGVSGVSGAAGGATAQLTRLQSGAALAVKGLGVLEAALIGFGVGTFLDQQFGLSDALSRRAGWKSEAGTFADTKELTAAQASLTTLAERLAGGVRSGQLTEDRALSNLRAVARASAVSMGVSEAARADAFAAQVVGTLRDQIVQGEVTVGIHIKTDGSVETVTSEAAKTGRIHTELRLAAAGQRLGGMRY